MILMVIMGFVKPWVGILKKDKLGGIVTTLFFSTYKVSTHGDAILKTTIHLSFLEKWVIIQ